MAEWIRALPLEPCGPFKDAAFCLKKGPKPQSGNQLIQQTPTGLNETNTDREGTMKRVTEREETGT